MSNVITNLERRRRELGLTYAALSKRSGVSVPTLTRTLSGNNNNASLSAVEAIALALGASLVCKETPVETMLEHEADRKAQKLVAMAQATSALEAQALGSDELERLRRQTVHQLMAGSKRKLWSD